MTTRRTFLQGTTALVTALLSPKLLSDEVTEFKGTFSGEPWHSHNISTLGDMPTRVLIVVPSNVEADKIYTQMGRPENVKIIGVGAMLCGYGADYIITDDECEKMEAPFGFYRDWYNQVVRTRLHFNGSHIQSRFKIEQFDWGNSHGLSMEFTDLDRELVLRQGVALRNKRYVSYEDIVRAKAALYTWWLRERGVFA